MHILLIFSKLKYITLPSDKSKATSHFQQEVCYQDICAVLAQIQSVLLVNA